MNESAIVALMEVRSNCIQDLLVILALPRYHTHIRA